MSEAAPVDGEPAVKPEAVAMDAAWKTACRVKPSHGPTKTKAHEEICSKTKAGCSMAGCLGGWPGRVLTSLINTNNNCSLCFELYFH